MFYFWTSSRAYLTVNLFCPCLSSSVRSCVICPEPKLLGAPRLPKQPAHNSLTFSTQAPTTLPTSPATDRRPHAHKPPRLPASTRKSARNRRPQHRRPQAQEDARNAHKRPQAQTDSTKVSAGAHKEDSRIKTTTPRKMRPQAQEHRPQRQERHSPVSIWEAQF